MTQNKPRTPAHSLAQRKVGPATGVRGVSFVLISERHWESALHAPWPSFPPV